VCCVVPEKRHRSRLIQPSQNKPCPMTASNTSGSWTSIVYVRLLPLLDGTCPTVHRSTANPSIANPKRFTSPRPLPVNQRATVR
ncbi:hypothetical protein K443DRAFT_60457, partial [Laccaria amethystina LaAM-08-1]